MDTIKHIVASDFEDKVRLRTYIIGIFPYLETASAAKKAIQRGEITIEGKEASTGDWVMADIEIAYQRPEVPTTTAKVQIDIISDFDEFLVLRKRAGILSSGNTMRSLQHRLKGIPTGHLPKGLPYPYLVHRLDRQTEGLIIAAKTITSRRIFDELLQENRIQKEYIALVQGNMDEAIKSIDTDIDTKKANTEIVRVVHQNTKDATSLLIVRPKTGREHQIRKHLLSIGHPIVGDKVYNQEGLDFRKGLLLGCIGLSFDYPGMEDRVEVAIPPGNKFSKYIQTLVENSPNPKD